MARTLVGGLLTLRGVGSVLEGSAVEERILAMDRLFSPRSILFVGASNSLGKWGGLVLRNLLDGGYEGEIYPVNPKEESVQGCKAYRSVLDVPGPADLAVFAIPAALIPDAISECAKLGVRAGVVVTAGFAELGENGEALQEEMVRRAREAGMILVGPNGQGISVPSKGLHPWFPRFRPKPGAIGIASQSGNLCTILSAQLAEFGLGCSKVISAGNCADLGWPDYLEYFRRDPETKVILLHVEGTGDGRGFLRFARRTAMEKPVVVLKTGRTNAGRRAARSHTGVLAGSDELFDDVCRQAGLVRAGSTDDAVLAAAALLTTPLPMGRRVGIVTGGGGLGVMAADACARLGLDVVQFSGPLIERLRSHLPPWWSPNNPVDLVGGLGYAGPADLVPILMESGEVDGVIAIGVGWVYPIIDGVDGPLDLTDPRNVALKRRVEETVRECGLFADYARRWNKPLILTSPVARWVLRRKYDGLLDLLERGVMLYPTVEDGARVFSILADRHDLLKKVRAQEDRPVS